MDEEYKKLAKRLSITIWLLVGALCLAIIALAVMYLVEPRTEVRYVTEQAKVGPRGEQGAQGIPGPVGERGPVGTTGRDAQEVLRESQVVIERTTPGATGPKGEQGQPGKDAREVELQRNPQSGDIEWRYIGDRLWQTLVPVCEIKVCEVDDGSANH